MLSPFEYTVSFAQVLILTGPLASAWLPATLSNFIVSFNFLVFLFSITGCTFASSVTAPPPPVSVTVGCS